MRVRFSPAKLAWISFAALGLSSIGFAQSPKTNVLRRPASLTEYDPCIGPQPGLGTQEWWRVWIDRDGVPVYDDATLKEQRNKAGFLQPFYVAQVSPSGDAMLLVRSQSQPYSSTIVVDDVVGWVRTEHLLLNSMSARSAQSIRKRSFTPSADARESNRLAPRTGPVSSAKALEDSSGSPGSSVFSYVYKYDQCPKKGWMLVGARPTISSLSGPESVILGWIPSDRSMEWSTREAFEPDPKRTLPAHVFATAADLDDYYAGKSVKPIITDMMNRNEWPAEEWRYLLISSAAGSNKAHVMFVTTDEQRRLTMGDGWVRLTDNTGLPVVRPVYLISENDLLSSIRILEDFTKPGFADPVGLVEIWKKAIETATGGIPVDPQDYLSVATGLSFRSLSPFLGQPFDKLLKASADEISRFLTAAQTAVEKLQKLRDNQSLWFMNAGENYAWIPAASMP